MHPLLKHYLLVALFTSVISTIMFMFLSPQSGPMMLEKNEIFAFGLMFIVVSYSFIFVGGGLISTIIRYFTSKLSFVFISFLLVAIVLYMFNLSFSSSLMLLAAVNTLLFGAFDTFLSRKKEFFV